MENRKAKYFAPCILITVDLVNNNLMSKLYEKANLERYGAAQVKPYAAAAEVQMNVSTYC